LNIGRALIDFSREREEGGAKPQFFPRTALVAWLCPARAQARILQYGGARDTEDDMILRLWRGWTTSEKADRYEELIATAIFPGIAARAIPELDGLELFRRRS
jgi:hypothetical protein